jgi:hypothetical protein
MCDWDLLTIGKVDIIRHNGCDFCKANDATNHMICSSCIYDIRNIVNIKRFVCVNGETGCDTRHRWKTCEVGEKHGRIVRHMRISICWIVFLMK